LPVATVTRALNDFEKKKNGMGSDESVHARREGEKKEYAEKVGGADETKREG
jgi:hypothetical protein